MKKIVVALLALMLIAFCACAEGLTIVTATDAVMSGYSLQAEAVLDGKTVSAEWSISGSSLAAVSSEGKVTAKKLSSGSVDFRLRATYGDYIAEKVISIVPEAKSLIMYCGDANAAKRTFNLNAGDTLSLHAVCVPAESAKAAMWVSSDEEVATVNSDGLVTVIGPGVTDITVQLASGRYSHCTVKVYVPVKSISLPEKIEIASGKTERIRLLSEPENAWKSASFNWSSNNRNVARISTDGKLIAGDCGTAVITCRGDNGLYATAEVEVYRGANSITVDKNNVILAVNGEQQLKFAVSPKNARYTELTYTSSDESVAVIDENGLVKAVGEGKCVITAENAEGKTANVSITAKYIPLKEAQFTSRMITVNAGSTVQLNLKYEPQDASEKNAVIISEDESVASVSGCELTALSEGRTVISAWVDGIKTAEIPVKVIAKDAKPLDGVKIGVNPGHQIAINSRQVPLWPGSSITGNANSGYAVGIETRTREYEVALSVGLYLRDMLEELGAEVVMTRTENDVHIDNVQRAIMLNEAGVDFAIQLHCNNNPENHTSSGISMFVKSKDPVSYEIAACVLDSTCLATGARNLRLRLYDRYMSLNYSTTPAALIEMGYLSTPEDDRLLATDAYRYKLAEGICNGILEYFTSHE